MWHRQFVKFVGDDVNWEVYKVAILKRFGKEYDDPLGEIKKLRQVGSVQSYIDAYDTLRQVGGTINEFLYGWFTN